MTAEWRDVRPLAILDFDLECRPLSWYGGDWVTKEITAIGARFIGERKGRCWLLGPQEPRAMLTEFREWYDRADIVTGHFIRGFDLPLLNAGYIEYGMAPLTAKLAHDTKTDLVKFSGLSKSQENLGALFGLKHPKVSMNQQTWREANRLTPEGIKLTEARVMGDVNQHIELRAELMRRDALNPPSVWRPNHRPVAYEP